MDLVLLLAWQTGDKEAESEGTDGGEGMWDWVKADVSGGWCRAASSRQSLDDRLGISAQLHVGEQP